MKNYDYALPEHDVEYVPEVQLDTLLIDPQAQRILDPRRASAIADTLVPSAVGCLTVSVRDDGRSFLVDGQHRASAVQMAGYTHWPAEVHYGLTQEQEAILFLIKNRESKAPNSMAEYFVGLTAGVPLFVDIQNVLNKQNLSVGSPSTNLVGAISCLQDIVRKYGAEVLADTLSVIDQSWERSSQSWDGTLVGGLGELLGRHSGHVNTERLMAKLSKSCTSRIVSKATEKMAEQGCAKRHGAYLALRDLYNSNLGSKSADRLA